MRGSEVPLTARTLTPATMVGEPVTARIRRVNTGSLWRFEGKRGSHGRGRGKARDPQGVRGGLCPCPIGFLVDFLGGPRLRTAKPGRDHRARHLRPATGIALYGFDAVAYFVDGEARQGLAGFELKHAGLVWRFRDEGNRAAFAARPGDYMPASAATIRWGSRTALRRPAIRRSSSSTTTSWCCLRGRKTARRFSRARTKPWTPPLRCGRRSRRNSFLKPRAARPRR